MSIDKHGNVWRFRVTRNGIPYTRNYDGPENKLQKAYAAFLVDIERGEIGQNENMKFQSLAQLVMDQYVRPNCAYNTVEVYKNNYNTHILEHFGNMKISKIKPLHIQTFITNLNKKGLSPNTIGSIISCLKKTFEMAVKWELIIKNPCNIIDTPTRKKYNNRGQLMTTEEMTRLITIYDNLNSKPSKMHRLAFYIALGCGLRNSEIRALTLDDIDFENSSITVSKQSGRYLKKGEVLEGDINPKSESSKRVVYAPDFVIDEIKRYIGTLDCIPMSKQLFWSSRTNKPVGRQCLSTFFTNILIKNNLPIIDFHDLRHLHATLLAAKGVNIKTLATRMGHSKIETTNIYMQTIDTVDKQVAETLDAAITNLKKAHSI